VKSFLQRPISIVMFVIVMTLGLMGVRAASEARSNLALAASYRHDGELLRAVEHYRRALRWSFLLSPYTDPAVSGLQACAAELEAAGDLSSALLAWRSLLGGLSATRVMVVPPSRSAERAKDEIARLEALEVVGAGRPGAAAEQTAKYRRQLDDRMAPHPLWGTLLLIGFATWVVSLASLTSRGFDRDGRFRWRLARGSVWSCLGGLLAFVLGLAFA
jgi:hypothetical protein